MLKLRPLLFAVVLMGLLAQAGSAAPAPTLAFCAQVDPLQQIFLAAAGGLQANPTCGPFCNTSDGFTSPTSTGIGTSCTVAQSNLSTQLTSYADSVCGASCRVHITTTVACHASGSGFSVSGFASFGCRDSTC
jgi:hypothetical protein